eukprot:jgi/Hompol1/6143/HPOL_002188-RA
MWESQLSDEQSPTAKKPSAVLTKDELKILEDPVDGIVFEESNNVRIIKGGRVNKLIEAATHHERHDDDFMAAIILTHHSFMTSSELLDQIFRRYDIAPPYGLNQRLFDLFIDKKLAQVRLRVCHFLQWWIENHFEEDFAEFDQHIIRFRDFVEKKVSQDSAQRSAALLTLLERKLMEDPKQRQVPKLTAEQLRQCPKPLVQSQRTFSTIDPLTALVTDPKGFLEIEPLEMARQLTLIEFDLFARVKPFECLDPVWEGVRAKESLAMKGLSGKKVEQSSVTSDISKLIQHTNQLSYWIATNIVTPETPKARMLVLKYFVQIAIAFEDRFPKIYESYKELENLVSPKKQYANYRKALKEIVPPAIPFLGVFLTDLTFLGLGNPDFLPDSHFINFEKRRKVYLLIRDMQRFQQVPFSLAPVPAMQEFFRRLGEKKGMAVGWEEMPVMNDDELYQHSVFAEPIEEESDTE